MVGCRSDPAVAVVDASVAVEYLVELSLAAQATALFRRLAADDPIELWAPDLLHLEVASALRKLARRKQISGREGEAALRRLIRLPLRTTGTSGIVLGARRLRDKLAPYDAAYVLLARELDAPLITADTRFSGAVPRGTRVHLLQDL